MYQHSVLSQWVLIYLVVKQRGLGPIYRREKMKNGFTPKEYAYSVAMDALYHAIKNKDREVDDITESEQNKVIDQMKKLREVLAQKSRLDITPI